MNEKLSQGWVKTPGSAGSKWVGWRVLFQLTVNDPVQGIARVASRDEARKLVKLLGTMPGFYWCEWWNTESCLNHELWGGEEEEKPGRGTLAKAVGNYLAAMGDGRDDGRGEQLEKEQDNGPAT